MDKNDRFFIKFIFLISYLSVASLSAQWVTTIGMLQPSTDFAKLFQRGPTAGLHYRIHYDQKIYYQVGLHTTWLSPKSDYTAFTQSSLHGILVSNLLLQIEYPFFNSAHSPLIKFGAGLATFVLEWQKIFDPQVQAAESEVQVLLGGGWSIPLKFLIIRPCYHFEWTLSEPHWVQWHKILLEVILPANRSSATLPTADPLK